MILTNILGLIILVLAIVLIVGFIVEYGGIILKIIAHLAGGWILLFIINFIPGIYVPINLLTIAISGFGGILGVILLILISFL